jgi:hypothetical protein
MAGLGTPLMDAKVMSTMKRFAITFTTILACLAVSGVGHPARAQDVQVQGPLAGAPAVIGLRVYREMRFSIQLHAAMSLQDEFSRAIMPGAQLMFHPADWLGIGVWASIAAANIDSALTDQIVAKGQTNTVNVLSLPNAKKFPDQIGRLKWIVAPQVSFIPLRGKLGIFEKLFVDTDFYVFGGIAFVGLEERANVDFATANNCVNMSMTTGLASSIGCLAKGQTDRASRMAIAPTFGAGLSLYLADFLTMSIEWRALPFAWNTSGTDESGNPRGDFPDTTVNQSDRLSHFNHFLTLGFGFYLPVHPRISKVEE